MKANAYARPYSYVPALWVSVPLSTPLTEMLGTSDHGPLGLHPGTERGKVQAKTAASDTSTTNQFPYHHLWDVKLVGGCATRWGLAEPPTVRRPKELEWLIGRHKHSARRRESAVADAYPPSTGAGQG